MKKFITLQISGRDMMRILRTGGINDLSRSFCEIEDVEDEEVVALQAEWKAMNPIFERLKGRLSNAIHAAQIDPAELNNAKAPLSIEFELTDEEIAHLRLNNIEPRVMCEMAYEYLAEMTDDSYYEQMARAFDDLAKWLSRIYQLMLVEMLGEDEVRALDFKF